MILEIGMKHTVETLVTPENTAAKAGSGNLQVFGTPFMVALMENAALPAVCFDLSQEWHGEAVGLLEDIIRIDSLRSVSGSFYTFTAALTGNRHIRRAGRTRNGFVRCSPSSMKTISLISPWMIFPATSISAKASAAGSLRVT